MRRDLLVPCSARSNKQKALILIIILFVLPRYTASTKAAHISRKGMQASKKNIIMTNCIITTDIRSLFIVSGNFAKTSERNKEFTFPLRPFVAA